MLVSRAGNDTTTASPSLTSSRVRIDAPTRIPSSGSGTVPVDVSKVCIEVSRSNAWSCVAYCWSPVRIVASAVTTDSASATPSVAATCATAAASTVEVKNTCASLCWIVSNCSLTRMSVVSSIPHETRISVSARTTPMTVDRLRRGLRPMARIDIRHRIGRCCSGGTSRSGRLGPERAVGAAPRIASAGVILDAARAGASAAKDPITSPKSTPSSGVNG